MEKDCRVPIRIHPHRLEAGTNLVGDRLRHICLANPPVAAQQIENEQVWDLRAIGKAASFDPEDPTLADLPVKLGEEPRFADTGLADDPDHLAATGFGLSQEVAQNRELVFAVDKSRHACRCRLTQSGAPMRNVEQAIGRYRLGLALERERPDGLDASKTLRQEAGCIAHEDRSRLRRLLKSGRDIGRVADHRVVHRQSVADRTKDHRPAVDAYAYGQIQSRAGARLLVAERLANGDGGQQSTPDMVLMGQRSAEKGEKPVAGELWRRAAIAMHLGEARLQKRADEVAHCFGSEARGQRRRVHDVAEQHADLLHFAGQHIRGRCDRRSAGPRCIELGGTGSLERWSIEPCSAATAE